MIQKSLPLANHLDTGPTITELSFRNTYYVFLVSDCHLDVSPVNNSDYHKIVNIGTLIIIAEIVLTFEQGGYSTQQYMWVV